MQFRDVPEQGHSLQLNFGMLHAIHAPRRQCSREWLRRTRRATFRVAFGTVHAVEIQQLVGTVGTFAHLQKQPALA